MNESYEQMVIKLKTEDVREIIDWFIESIIIKKAIGELDGAYRFDKRTFKEEIKNLFNKTYRLKQNVLQTSQLNQIIDSVYEEYQSRGAFDEIGLS